MSSHFGKVVLFSSHVFLFRRNVLFDSHVFQYRVNELQDFRNKYKSHWREQWISLKMN